ncbi:hypothetical protein TSUD_161080 [Trifolium subterraneum]|uniref:Uncharacterized protein n=1 Tax=Trifolium subterraneum TaxID=3900 RepID=A0A2Z6MYZ4_TRISU|nr:hypothetical protein TSUD_161080 [Trifolium subterraneum]
MLHLCTANTSFVLWSTMSSSSPIVLTSLCQTMVTWPLAPPAERMNRIHTPLFESWLILQAQDGIVQ